MSPWRQRFKWAVYAVLLLDFFIYLAQDVESAHYVLDARSSLLEFAGAYVTSIDLAAWFALILLFELETYVLAGRAWQGGMKWTVRGVRLVCCAAILHTSFSYDITLRELQNPRPLPLAGDACAYAKGDWSFLRNREYIEVDSGNCADLGQGAEYFALGDDAVITDRAGVREGLVLAWTDLLESIAWLMVVMVTELAVRLNRSAVALTLLEGLKGALYMLILGIAFYWGWKQQYLYLWDELIWVCGFLIIDFNIHDRRSGRPSRLAMAST